MDACFELEGATELGLLSGRALFPPVWPQGWEGPGLIGLWVLV